MIRRNPRTQFALALLGLLAALAGLTACPQKEHTAELVLEQADTNNIKRISCVEFSPDGRILAVGTEDHIIRLWDVAQGHLLYTLSGHENRITALAFSHDGKTIASGSQDNTIKLWDVDQGQLLRTLSGHTDDVTAVAFNPDGKTLASASQDNTIKLWDIIDGELLRNLNKTDNISEEFMVSMHFQESDILDTLSVIAEKGMRFELTPEAIASLRLENIPEDIRQKLQELKNTVYITEKQFVEALETKIGKNLTKRYQMLIPKNAKRKGLNLAVHPLVAGNVTTRFVEVPWYQALQSILNIHNLQAKIDGNILVIMPVAITEPYAFTRSVDVDHYKGQIISIHFQSADILDVLDVITEVSGLNRVVFPGTSGLVTARLENIPWDQALNTILKLNDLTAEFERNVMIIGSATIFQLQLYAPSGLRNYQEYEEQLANFKFTQQSFKHLEAENVPGNILENLMPLKDTEFIGAKEFLNAIETHIGKEQTLRYETLILFSAEKLISLHFQEAPLSDVLDTLAELKGLNLIIHPGIAGTVTFRLENIPWGVALDVILKVNSLYAEIEGQNLTVMPVEPSQQDPQQQTDTSNIPNGSEPTAQDEPLTSSLNTVNNFDAAINDEYFPYSLSFSPDGKLLASGSRVGTITLWDIGQNKPSHTLYRHLGLVYSVKFSPDGKIIASGSIDGTIKFWEVDSGKMLNSLSKHEFLVESVIFSPDFRTIAIGNNDGMIMLWDIEDGKQLFTFPGYEKTVSPVAFSPDGQILAVGSDDGTVNLWDLTSGELRVTFALWPDNQWFTYHPQKLVYRSSPQGDEQVMVRFDGQPSPLYPLKYYQEELKLKQEDILLKAFQTEQPSISPKRVRLWWDTIENKELWGGGIIGSLVIVALLTYAYILQKRSDPIAVAKQFFLQAGFQKVETLSETLLLLHSKEALKGGLAILWQEENLQGKGHIQGTAQQKKKARKIAATIRKHCKEFQKETKLYLVYKGKGPSKEAIHKLRQELNCETIPLPSSLLERVLFSKRCEGELRELEEPYLTRLDPYTEANPIRDPNWFYGRDTYLKRLPAMLMQGRHVGLFGLRKVGKTSLINQLRQRFATVPTVYLDCQAFSANADTLFHEILNQLNTILWELKVKRLPKLPQQITNDTFRQHLLTLFGRWEHTGRREPFLLIFDEIDKFFPALPRPTPSQEGSNTSPSILQEYVRLFRTLRGLSQTRQCLVTLVVAYRPDVNRVNLLTPEVGENPMFMSFQEEYLGFLNPEDSATMICEIGQWKDIVWEENAAQWVFYYCGGHPFVTRTFAGEACEEGALKQINYARVEQTASDIRRNLHKHDIAAYYKAVWETLTLTEQSLLLDVCRSDGQPFVIEQLAPEQEEALTYVEQFGLVTVTAGKVYLSANLFDAWLRRRILSMSGP